MKKIVIILSLIGPIVYAQSAFQNSGNVQIHSGGAIGFHTNLINNGTFDANDGLAGFYSLDDYLVIAGNNEAVFKDMEIAVFDNLYLNTSVGVSNELMFITGDVVSPRSDTSISLDFINHDLYIGEGDDTHVDGYAQVYNTGEFIFPIGDGVALRPMIIPNQVANTTYKGAYFRENPNFPSTFSEAFDTSEKESTLKQISIEEFWDLNGATETAIKLTWDKDSDVASLTTNVNNVTVVGWSKAQQKWIDLGGEEVTGDLNEGTVLSRNFVPDEYEILTIGADYRLVLGASAAYNYNVGISPNGDGLNDTFVIDGIEERPNNILKIYNRWGRLVYSKKAYDNSWGGISENSATVSPSSGLPTGTYFYVLDLYEDGVRWQGWIYINR